MSQDSTKLYELASVVRNLPAKATGRFTDGNRVLELKERQECLELHLRMTLTDSTIGDPLLNAKVSIPLAADAAPAVESLRRLGGGRFLRREERYLHAMIAWAHGVLSTPLHLDLSPTRKRSPWKAPLRAFISAAANDAGTAARLYFRLRGDALYDLDEEHRALDAAYYLRDSGKAIHIDWRDGDSLAPLCAEVARETGHERAIDPLGIFKPAGDMDSDLTALRRLLSELGLAITQIETGDDSNLFVLTTEKNATVAAKALQKLGVSASF